MGACRKGGRNVASGGGRCQPSPAREGPERGRLGECAEARRHCVPRWPAQAQRWPRVTGIVSPRDELRHCGRLHTPIDAHLEVPLDESGFLVSPVLLKPGDPTCRCTETHRRDWHVGCSRHEPTLKTRGSHPKRPPPKPPSGDGSMGARPGGFSGDRRRGTVQRKGNSCESICARARRASRSSSS
jgi:hypothetical protein